MKKNRSRMKFWPLPSTRENALPPQGFFATDDFMRARYFSAVIEKYTTKAETETLVKFARERRMPGMSFADTLEAMGSYLHMGPLEAKDKLLAQTQAPKEQLERVFVLTETVQKAVRESNADSGTVFKALVQGLRLLFPSATDERIKGAIDAGNLADGFSVPAVIEAMQLTEPEATCSECNGVTVLTKGSGVETQFMICAKWKEPGHLDTIGIEMHIRELKKRLRPSGRHA